MADAHMADAPRETWITGIGIVSSLGEGADRTGRGFRSDASTSTPRPSRPIWSTSLARSDLDKQIPKKGDQRQMEAWQRIGNLCGRDRLGGCRREGQTRAAHPYGHASSRPPAASATSRSTARSSPARARPANPGAFLNERLMSDLRPTLFLAQLSNLLAGNISIVHGVTGSSRTFMGEEAAGVDAVRIAHRAHCRRAKRARAGGRIAQRGTRGVAATLRCRLTHVNAARSARSGSVRHPPAWCSARSAHSSSWRPAATHRRAAQSRWARLSAVMSERSSRPAGATTAAGRAHVAKPRRPAAAGRIAVISGCYRRRAGNQPKSAPWLETLPGVPVRATGSSLGPRVSEAAIRPPK